MNDLAISNTSGLWLPMNLPDHDYPVLREGRGNRLYDVQGRCYIDLCSGLWNVPLGFDHEAVNAAVSAQLRQLPYANPELFSNQAAETYARSLLGALPDRFEKVLLTTTGSEAVEAAIKMIRRTHALKQNVKKKLIGTFNLGYHGSYYGSMTATGFEHALQAGYGPMLDGFIHLTPPLVPDGLNRANYGESTSKQQQKQLLALLEQLSDQLAALIIEPVFASAGVLSLPPDLLRTIVSFCREHDILIVFDEIASGFGRGGSLFYFQTIGCEPDLLLLSKGINNGVLPLSAVVISSEIVETFRLTKTLFNHLSTQNMNPVCAAAAEVVLAELAGPDERWSGSVASLEASLDQVLASLHIALRQVVATRRVGLMAAIELADRETGQPLDRLSLARLVFNLRDRGYLVTPSFTERLTSAIVIMPAFVTTKADLDAFGGELTLLLR